MMILELFKKKNSNTQAIYFKFSYSNDCVDCQRLQARLEAVGAKVKNRANIARINRLTTGASTARRFEVYNVPAFILFKQGKMYRYHIQVYDVASFVSFITEWYKNVTPEKVPLPKTPFDDLTSLIAVYIKENSWLVYVGIGTFLMGVIVALFSKKGQETQQQKKSKEKPKAKKDK
nr:thioredoxin domain-containing protein-like [Onthophagus taurus]